MRAFDLHQHGGKYGANDDPGSAWFIIGHIEDMTQGRQRAFNFAGRILGTYDLITGKTVDDTFRVVGTGNQLMGLIERAK